MSRFNLAGDYNLVFCYRSHGLATVTYLLSNRGTLGNSFN